MIPVQIYFRTSDGELDRIKTVNLTEEQWAAINYVDYISVMDGDLDPEFRVHGIFVCHRFQQLIRA